MACIVAVYLIVELATRGTGLVVLVIFDASSVGGPIVELKRFWWLKLFYHDSLIVLALNGSLKAIKVLEDNHTVTHRNVVGI